MRKSLLTLLAMAGIGLMARGAWACPDDNHGKKDAKGATTASTTTEGASQGATEAKSGSPCAKGCTKPCGNCDKPCNSAQLTSDTPKSEDKAHAGCSHAKKAAEAVDAKDENKAHAGCSHAKSAAMTADSSGGCPKSAKMQAVLASMPTLQYRVGTEVTPCEKTAGAMAEKASAKVEYMVGDEAFADRAAAQAKLVTLLDTRVEEMQTLQFAVGSDCMKCPMTAKRVAEEKKAQMAYRVGGVDFETREAAEKALEAVKIAAASVKVAYKVGDESFCCDKMAGARAKETGKPIVVQVADAETTDKYEAQVRIDQAKARAMVEAALAAQGS